MQSLLETDAIKSGMRFHKEISANFIKEIQDTKTAVQTYFLRLDYLTTIFNFTKYSKKKNKNQ